MLAGGGVEVRRQVEHGLVAHVDVAVDQRIASFLIDHIVIYFAHIRASD